MNEVKAVLFDADGVLSLPEDFFSNMYAHSRGLSAEPFERFFKEQFQAALLGKADLKDLIIQKQDVWHWEGKVDELLSLWFEAENVKNEPLLTLIESVRQKGKPCFIATNQEKYRGEYLRNVMFKDMFDGYFISCDLGVKKPDAEFFRLVLEKIEADYAGIEAGSILFIDDTHSHIEQAKQLGFSAHLYQSVEQVAELLSLVQ